MELQLMLTYIFILTIIVGVLNRETMLKLLIRKQKFECDNCGKCCQFWVRLSDEEIEKIKKVTNEDFVEMRGKIKTLKRINGRCVFQEIKKGKSNCAIYNVRPQICRKYPRTKFLGLDTYDVRCLAIKKPKLFRYL